MGFFVTRFLFFGGGVGRGGGRSICWWTGNKDVQYGISRFLESKTVPVITGKNNKKSGSEIIINGISIFGHLLKKFIFFF